MNFVKRWFNIFLLLIVGCYLTACTAPPIKQRYLWPPPPEQPRIEWIGAYSNQYDIKPPSIFTLLVGEELNLQLKRPIFLTSDSKGKVYVTDTLRKHIVVFDFNEADVHLLGGEITRSIITQPSGVATDDFGHVYAGDAKSNKIFVLGPNERIVKEFDLSKKIDQVGGIAVDSIRKRLIVPDPKGHKVGIFDLLTGDLIKMIGKRGPGDAEFNFPEYVAVDRNGRILVADNHNARLQLFTPEGNFIRTIGRRGDSPGDFNIIKGVAFDSEGHIYVTDAKENRVSIFNDKGELLLVFGGLSSIADTDMMVAGGFYVPHGIYIDHNDRIYVADSLNARFQVFQYMNEKYLREHPVNKEDVAKPVEQPQKPKK
jgi:DNA-binding beta-propeller fold protein YncE